MTHTSVICYGSNSDEVLRYAREAAIEHMALGANLGKDEIKKSILANTYPNFLHIKKDAEQSDIPIEHTRKMVEFLLQKSAIRGKMAALIENCEEMSRNAANSVLKILEEPPRDVVIILTTTKLQSIMPTIRSRCLKILVPTSRPYAYEISDVKSYIVQTLSHIDTSLIGHVTEFIQDGCRDFVAFAKQNSENALKFFEIAICYCYFLCIKKCEITIANVVLKLQSLENLAKTTHPDGQSAILAACTVLRDEHWTEHCF